MKKTLKKSISVMLTVLLLFSCFSGQGYAILGFDKITGLQLNDYEKFSLKEIREYVTYLEEDGYEPDDEEYQYVLSCDADVTISTGEVINVSDMDYGYSKNGKRVVDVYAYVDARECISAFEAGESTVTLYLEVYLESSIGVKLDEKVYEEEISLVECFVKNLRLVSGEIEVSTVNNYVLSSYVIRNLEDLSFEITYGDGSVITASPTVESEGGGYYLLDGEELFIDFWNDEEDTEPYAEIYFYDFVLEAPLKVLPFPIASVSIDNVDFDTDFNEKVIEYTVTKTNGETVKQIYNVVRPEQNADVSGYDTAFYRDTFEGMNVIIAVISSKGEEYPPKHYKDVLIYFSEDVYAEATFEGPQEEGTVLGEIIFKIVSFIKSILNRIFGE